MYKPHLPVNKMLNSPPKSTFELIVDLIKVTVWPILVVCILFVFWTPLYQTANLIPSIVGRSDVITIAGLSLKISQEQKSKAPLEVERILGKLSKTGIERVLALSDSAMYMHDSINFAKRENSELIKLGLAIEIPSTEL